MAAIDQNQTEERELKYSSFCERDDQMIDSVVERLRRPGSTAAITSDKYSLSDHYIREIVSNVFLDPRAGDIRRGPLDRESVVSRINENLSDEKSFNKSAANKGLRELWIYNANAAEDLPSIALAASLITQFKASGISILVSCSNISVRTPDFSKWTKKARLNLWRFELPDTDMKSLFITNAKIRGSIHTARDLISDLNDPKSEKDLDYYFPAPKNPKIIPIQSMTEAERKKKTTHKKKGMARPATRADGRIKDLVMTFGCILLALSLTGAIFWKELSGNEVIPNLLGSLSVLKPTVENLTVDGETLSPELFVDENLSTTREIGTMDTRKPRDQESTAKSEETETRVRTARPAQPLTEKTSETMIKPEEKVMISPAKPKLDTRATEGINTSSEFTRKIPLPLIGGNYYLQAAAFSRRASADRWIRNQKSSEKYKVAKKSNGFWVVLTGPFSEPEAARQQTLKAKQNQRPLVLNSNELDPMWIF